MQTRLHTCSCRESTERCKDACTCLSLERYGAQHTYEPQESTSGTLLGLMRIRSKTASTQIESTDRFKARNKQEVDQRVASASSHQHSRIEHYCVFVCVCARASCGLVLRMLRCTRHPPGRSFKKVRFVGVHNFIFFSFIQVFNFSCGGCSHPVVSSEKLPDAIPQSTPFDSFAAPLPALLQRA